MALLNTPAHLRNFSDAALCEECLVGNADAWTILLERYQRLIYSIPLKFRFSPQEAADVFQGVALDLFKELGRLRDRDRLRNWLISATQHRCIRHKQRRLVEPQSLESLPTAADWRDPGDPADQWLAEVQEESLVREAIAELSPRCRELVEWFFYADPPPKYDEIARRMGVVRNSVGFIRGRCLNKLREILAKKGFPEAIASDQPERGLPTSSSAGQDVIAEGTTP